jgi:hypothetical protein
MHTLVRAVALVIHHAHSNKDARTWAVREFCRELKLELKRLST